MDGAATTPKGQGSQGGEGPAANCAVCGKSLRGVGPDGTCSNCGTPAALSLRPAAPSQPASSKLTNRGEVVADDRPCLVCGYNLKAIPLERKCPECGTPVERSLQGDLLKYSDPEYVAKLRRGITLVEVAIALGIIFALAMVVGGAIMAFNGGMFNFSFTGGKLKPGMFGTTSPVLHGLLYERVMELVKTAISALGLLGWWLFSTQDPGLAERDRGHKSRQMLRVFLTLSAIAAGVTFLTTFVPSLMTQANAASNGILSHFTVKMAVSSLSNIAFLVGFIATLTYMIHLARRVPDAGLQKRADLYRWLLPLIAVLGFPLCFTGPVAAFVMYVVLIDEWRRRLGRLNQAVMQEDLGVGA